MCSLRDLYLGGVRQQHPQRNLQTFPRWVDDRDRTVSSFRPADDRKVQVVKRVQGVQDADVGDFCAQGVVGAGGTTPMRTASSRPAASRPIRAAGSRRVTTTSSFPKDILACSVSRQVCRGFAASLRGRTTRLLRSVCGSSPNFGPSPLSCGRCFARSRLLEAALRRSRAGAALPRPLHPPRRDLQPAAGFLRRRPGRLPLAGFRPRQPAAADESLARRCLILPWHKVRRPQPSPPRSPRFAGRRG